MKERLITLALAVGALVLFYTLMLPKPQPPGQERSQPRSTDDGPDGQVALWRWLDAQHVPVTSLRRRYDQLIGVDGKVAGTGNVMITVLPHSVPMRAGEADAIRRWVTAGNTLLVIAALDDTPTWTIGLEATFLPELKDLTGMTFSGIERPKSAPSRPPAPRTDQPRLQPIADHEAPGDDLKDKLQDMVKHPEVLLEPTSAHPLTEGVQTVHAHLSLPAARWRGETTQTAPLILMQRQDSGAASMWLLREGEGQVIVSAFASPFGNDEIGQSDNARLVSNILRWTRGAAGRVWFDDVHQGLSDYYDARAFFGDPRLHRTIGWLLLAWLVFVLGPLPLRSTYKLWKPLDEQALVDASGRFYSVAVAPLEAAQRLFDNFFNRLRANLSLPQNGQPLWEWLQAQSRIAPQERTRLQALYHRVQAGKRVKLAPLQTLLSDIQGKLA
jgi:Domain of unknown function (DUF4350)